MLSVVIVVHLFPHAVGLARQRGYKTLQLEADPNAADSYEKMGKQELKRPVENE